MKEYFEDSDLLSEPLVKWIKTFKYDNIDADFHNLSQLIGTEFLDNVITLITQSQNVKSTISNETILLTVADRLHHLRKLMREISIFYRNNLQQIVMLPAPNLVNISECTMFEDCQDDLRQFLILILGCATQCKMKDTFIGRISQLLDKNDQEQIEVYFETLANNSMTADSKTLSLDETMLHMHTQVTMLSNERGVFSEKYYDCFEKHSTSTFENNACLDSLPILIRPIVPVDHGGQWYSVYTHKINPLTSERNEEDVLVITYRPKLKLCNKPENYNHSGITEADQEKLSLAEDKLKENEKLTKEVDTLKQKLHELEFYKKKNKELHSDNVKLDADKQKFKNQLESIRQKEEDMVERLVDCQMKLDDAVAEREMDRQKIAELMQNRIKDGHNNDDSIISESDTEGNSKSSKNKRVRELEREIESLRTRLMEAQKQDNQSDEKWKFLELQKEKMEARRQLNESVEENERLRETLEKLENQLQKTEENLREMQDVANVTREANDDQVNEFEDRIKDLTKQVMLLRKKGGKLSGDQFQEYEKKEAEVMYETIQELSNEVTKLKAHNKILRQECDKLKRDVERVVLIEEENERLSDENKRLQKAFASREQTSDLSDELRRQNLQLGIENKKLRRMIDTLRYTLMQVDPYNKQKYNYITSM